MIELHPTHELDLTGDRVKRADNLFRQLKRQTSEWLESHSVDKCQQCDGTGLKASKLLNGGYSWDTHAYCDKCYGVGFVGIKNTMNFDGEKYICKQCQSVGCRKCDFTGFVDWITYAMGW